MTHTGSTLRIFQCRTRGDFTQYARASKTTQLQSHPRFPNRLAILNEDRILSGGCNEAFRRNSIKLSDCRAFRLCKTVPVSHIGSTRDFSNCRARGKTVPVSHRLQIFQCRTRGDFTQYARASKTTQLRRHPRFPNRLAILNEDRILSGGWNKAFRRNSIKLSPQGI